MALWWSPLVNSVVASALMDWDSSRAACVRSASAGCGRWSTHSFCLGRELLLHRRVVYGGVILGGHVDEQRESIDDRDVEVGDCYLIR
jgi:hypothetical protein